MGRGSGGVLSQQERIRNMQENERIKRRGRSANRAARARQNKGQSKQANNRSGRQAGRKQQPKFRGAGGGGGGGAIGNNASIPGGMTPTQQAPRTREEAISRARSADPHGPMSTIRTAAMLDGGFSPLDVFDAYYLDPKERVDWDRMRAFRNALIHKYRYQQPQLPTKLLNHIKSKHLQTQVYVQTLQYTCNDQFNSFSGCLQRTNNDIIMCEGSLTSLAQCKTALEHGTVPIHPQNPLSPYSQGMLSTNPSGTGQQIVGSGMNKTVDSNGQVISGDSLEHRNRLLSQLNPMAYPSAQAAIAKMTNMMFGAQNAIGSNPGGYPQQQHQQHSQPDLAALQHYQQLQKQQQKQQSLSSTMPKPYQPKHSSLLQSLNFNHSSPDYHDIPSPSPIPTKLFPLSHFSRHVSSGLPHDNEPSPLHSQQHVQRSQHSQHSQLQPTPLSPYPQPEHKSWTQEPIDRATIRPPQEPESVSQKVKDIWDKWSLIRK